MSDSTKMTVSCDICGEQFWEGIPEERPKRKTIGVWFKTEQTEGRFVEPYLANVHIDICQQCARETVRCTAIGAQGRNEYEIETVQV